MRTHVKLTIFVTILVVVIILSAWIGKLYFHAPSNTTDSQITIQNYNKNYQNLPTIGGSFKLVDQYGHTQTDVDFKGKIMLVYFGYTFCPDICPAALINITDALTELGTIAQQIQPIFITIDPERDTISHLKSYMENYHPQFLALTGDAQHINAAKQVYRVFGAKANFDDTSTEYIMNHSSIIYIMDRQGRFVTHMNHLTPPKEIVRILKEVISQ